VRELREVGRAILAAVIAAILIVNVGLVIGLIIGLALYVGSFVVPVSRRVTARSHRRWTLPHPIRQRRADAATIGLADELEAMADKITALVDEDGSADIYGDALSLFDRAHAQGVVARSERAKIENPLSLQLLAGMFRGLAAKVRQSVPEKHRTRAR
jgi:hypothetical protein